MKRTLIVAAALAVMSAFAADPAKIADLKAGKTDTALVSWWGFHPEDSTEFLQAAIDSGAKKVIVDYTGQDWIAGKTLLLRSDLELVIADKAVVKAKKEAFKGLGDSLFKAAGATNCVVRGEGSALLKMNRADYMDKSRYKPGEWRHIIYLQGVNGFTIRDLRLSGAGGDAVYVGSGQTPFSKNVRIENVVTDDSNRLGIAVISAEDLLIRGCKFERAVGSSPMGGIDFEPNNSRERLVNCRVEDCVFEFNRGAGISVSPNHLNQDSEPVSITFKNCRSENNALGLFLYPTRSPNITPPRGTVRFENCQFLKNENLFQDPVTGSIRFEFKNCVFTPGDKNSVISILCKFAKGREIGGLFFDNCRMTGDLKGKSPITLSYQGAGAVSDQIAGTLKIQEGSQEKTFDFPSFIKERKQYFDKINALKSAHDADLSKLRRMTLVRPRDPANDGATLRGAFTYIQYAEKGDNITIDARAVSGGYPQPLEIQLSSPSGKPLKKYIVPIDGKTVPVSFTAAETGYYTLTGVTVQRVDISSRHPGGAYLVKDGFQVLLPLSGKLYFEVPAGVSEFQIGVSADQNASVELLDPSGKCVMANDDVNSMTLFGAKRADASRSEIWALNVKKAVWQVSVKIYEPLLPLLSSNPDTLPLSGDPEKTVRATLPPPGKPVEKSNSPVMNPGFEAVRGEVPMYWQASSASGKYKTLSITDLSAEGERALRVECTDFVSILNAGYVKVAPGAKLRFSVQARGKGTFRFEASNYYEKNKRWVRPNAESPKFEVNSSDWKKYSFEFTVSVQDFGADGKIGWVRPMLGIFPGAALDFDDFTLDL